MDYIDWTNDNRSSTMSVLIEFNKLKPYAHSTAYSDDRIKNEDLPELVEELHTAGMNAYVTTISGLQDLSPKQITQTDKAAVREYRNSVDLLFQAIRSDDLLQQEKSRA
jgi:uncharacterized protein (UPF0210 family)